MSKEEKKKEIFYNRKNAWDVVRDEKNFEKVFEFNKGYKQFLKFAKTERKCVKEIVRLAKLNKFVDIESGEKSDEGKYYRIFKKKAVALVYLSENKNAKEVIKNGFNMIVSHIDSPRLDLKPNSLYEDEGFGVFKGQYYGGIKKYQYVSNYLAMHGIAYLKNGGEIEFSIGEKEDEPIFQVPDLLIHLSQRQREKKAAVAVEAEQLNVLVGNIPVEDKEVKERVKANVLEHLKEKNKGFKEEDLLFSEIQFVPANPPRDTGLDRSMISGYGQDDRVCAYASMQAMFDMKEKPKNTCINFFFDKEETGSQGNTGATSMFLVDMVNDVLDVQLKKEASSKMTRKVLMNSRCISADVTCGVNPNFKDATDKRNTALLGCGVGICKYTGSRGKYSTSDCSAEFLRDIRKCFDEAGVVYQISTLGKIDLGGGGTIAKFFAKYGMDVIDIGVALLGMHSQYEVSSKVDVYMTHRGYKAFFETI